MSRKKRPPKSLIKMCIHAYKLHESFGHPISVVRLRNRMSFSCIKTEFEWKYRLQYRAMRVYYRTDHRG